MANISLNGILALLKSAAGQAWENRNDPEGWECHIEQAGEAPREGRLTMISFEPTLIVFDVQFGKRVIRIEATPGSSVGPMRVKVDGERDSDARVVYKPVPSFGNPARFHLDFRRVTVDGEDLRVDLAYPR